MSQNILILHGINYWNTGDLGIVRAMVQRLKEEIPEGNITVLTHFGKITRPSHIPDNYISVPEIPYFITYPFVGKLWMLTAPTLLFLPLVFLLVARWLRIKPWIILPSRQHECMRQMLEADVVLSKGGNFIWDRGRGVPRFLLHLHAIYLAVLAGKSTIIYSQSIGPFPRRWVKALVHFVLKGTRLILVREELSLQYLAKSDKSKIVVTGDEAFVLVQASALRAREILERYGITEEHRPLVGITVLDWEFPFSEEKREVLFERYCESIVATVNYLTGERDAWVIFIPHLVGFWSTGDEEVMETIIARLQHPERVTKLEPELPEDTKAIIGQCKIFLGTRMHSNIFALGAEVPCIAISYLPKSEGIMHMLDLDRWVIAIDKVSPESLQSMTQELLLEENAVRRKIIANVGQVQEKARENAVLVKKLLDDTRQL